jgi:hypothetical protein
MKNILSVIGLVVLLIAFLPSCKKEGNNDAQLPTITCPVDITVSNDPGVYGATVTFTISSAYNFPGQTVPQTAGLASGSVFPIGTTVNTFVVTDASNNKATCSFNVTVKKVDSIHNLPLNDYLPLKVGAIYKYKYSAYYNYVFDRSEKVGECTWKFISKSVDTTTVYQVEQSFTGYYVYEQYYPEQKDSTQIENQISTLSFVEQNDLRVAFHFSVPYWGDSKVTIQRFIYSDKIDTCFSLSLINGVCLRKNVGITCLSYAECGNHCSSVCYSLIEGPYY